MALTELPVDFLGIAAVAMLLGLRHGLDVDHLAAIDALVCHNAPRHPRVARLSGALFSLGHGIVVVGVAVGVSLLARAWQTPQWLEALGAWITVGVLLSLALVNIAAVLRTPHDQVARLSGWRTGVFGRLLRAESPVAVMGVGTLFALSFDTVSQAALFAATGSAHGGWGSALVFALLFIVGMLVTDGINGWWIARLVSGGARRARIASRVVSLGVSAVGIVTAGLTMATRFD